MRDSLTRAQKQEVCDIMGAQYVRSGEHMLLEYTLCINYNVQSLNILKKWTLISGCMCVCLFLFVIHFWRWSLTVCEVCGWSVVGLSWKPVEGSMEKHGKKWKKKSVEIPFFRLQLCLWGSYGEKHMERGS